MKNEFIITYLAIIVKVGFEYVLNIERVRSVNLIPEEVEKPVSLVLASKISHVMVQSLEVEKLMKHSPSNWWVLLLWLVFVDFFGQELEA